MALIISIVAFILSLISSSFIAVLAGLAIHFGFVSFLTIYVVVVISDLISSSIWYAIGRTSGSAFISIFGKFLGINQESIVRAVGTFNSYKNWLILIPRAAVGLGSTVISLISPGLLKVPYFRYISLETVAQLIWLWVMIAIGYGFGTLFSIYPSLIGRSLLVLVLIIFIFFLISFGSWIRSMIVSRIYKK